MKFKRIVKRIYLVTVTLIYTVAVAVTLAGIVGFAILNEISKQVTPSQNYGRLTQKKRGYVQSFKPKKASALSSKEKHLLS